MQKPTEPHDDEDSTEISPEMREYAAQALKELIAEMPRDHRPYVYLTSDLLGRCKMLKGWTAEQQRELMDDLSAVIVVALLQPEGCGQFSAHDVQNGLTREAAHQLLREIEARKTAKTAP
jgi:hypothetical protein